MVHYQLTWKYAVEISMNSMGNILYNGNIILTNPVYIYMSILTHLSNIIIVYVYSFYRGCFFYISTQMSIYKRIYKFEYIRKSDYGQNTLHRIFSTLSLIDCV